MKNTYKGSDDKARTFDDLKRLKNLRGRALQISQYWTAIASRLDQWELDLLTNTEINITSRDALATLERMCETEHARLMEESRAAQAVLVDALRSMGIVLHMPGHGPAPIINPEENKPQ